MTGEDYEAFVRAAIVHWTGIDPARIKTRKVDAPTLPDLPPLSHQIDLMLIEETSLGEYITIIECKYRSKPDVKVTRRDVEKLAFVRNSLRASKALLMTNTGFDGGARTLAVSERIGLIVVRPNIRVQRYDFMTEERECHAMARDLEGRPARYDRHIITKSMRAPNQTGPDAIDRFFRVPRANPFRNHSGDYPQPGGLAAADRSQGPGIYRCVPDIYYPDFERGPLSGNQPKDEPKRHTMITGEETFPEGDQ